MINSASATGSGRGIAVEATLLRGYVIATISSLCYRH